jgi:2'-5' RNA ligase
MGCSATDGGEGRYCALIGFIPGALGEYLDALRRQLVPGCPFRSHVTILPPRLVQGAPGDLSADLARRLQKTAALDIGIGEIEIFPATNVVYLEVEAGGEALNRMHEQLARDTFGADEPYPFHPHVTLAQEFPEAQLEELVARAAFLWKEWTKERRFVLERLSFVRGVDLSNWEIVSEHELNRSQFLKTA